MTDRVLTAARATERNWCLYCPDLIVEGETAATAPDLKDPLGHQGHTHADCARANGWTVNGEDGPDIDGRAAFRKHIRRHGPVVID